MASKQSKHFRFKNVEYWAQDGRVYMLDLEKCADSRAHLLEQVITLSPGELMMRAIAVRMGVNERFKDQVAAARKLLDEAKFVAKAAVAQGDPTDRKVLEHVTKHKRSSRALITDTRESFGGHALDTGFNYKLQLGDPRTMLLSGAQVTPDLALPRGMKLPPARVGAKPRRR